MCIVASSKGSIFGPYQTLHNLPVLFKSHCSNCLIPPSFLYIFFNIVKLVSFKVNNFLFAEHTHTNLWCSPFLPSLIHSENSQRLWNLFPFIGNRQVLRLRQVKFEIEIYNSDYIFGSSLPGFHFIKNVVQNKSHSTLD